MNGRDAKPEVLSQGGTSQPLVGRGCQNRAQWQAHLVISTATFCFRTEKEMLALREREEATHFWDVVEPNYKLSKIVCMKFSDKTEVQA